MKKLIVFSILSLFALNLDPKDKLGTLLYENRYSKKLITFYHINQEDICSGPSNPYSPTKRLKEVKESIGLWLKVKNEQKECHEWATVQWGELQGKRCLSANLSDVVRAACAF